MTRVVKRSGSHIFFALGVLICVVLTVGAATIAVQFYHLTQEYGLGDLPEIIQLELQEAWLQVIFAALVMLLYADRLWAVTRLDRRRQAAARGEGRTISRELELRSLRPTILTPPTTLRLRMAWHSKQMMFVYLAVFLIIQLLVAFTLLTMLPLTGEMALITLSIDVGLLGFLALLVLFMSIAVRERVEVSEDGLRVSRFGVSRIVRWSEARLFAKVRKAEYELSSASSIVRWTRTLDASAIKPTIPLDEYQRQMDGLLLLIAERTGLRLYDVSDGKD